MKKLRHIFHSKSASISSPVPSSTPSSPTDDQKIQNKFSFRRTNSTNNIFGSSGKTKTVSAKPIPTRALSIGRRSQSTSDQNTFSVARGGSRQVDQNTTKNPGALVDSNGKHQSQIRFEDKPQLLDSEKSSLDLKKKVSTPLTIVTKNIDKQNLTLPETPNTVRQNEADEFIQQAIQFHETNQLEKATFYFKLAADQESPLGMFLYGIALRHGWGCKVNRNLAVRYLQKAAESAVFDLHASVAANPSIARHELVLAIYELGICFRHGWGVSKNKTTAAYYFEIAAKLGDPDAQNDLGFAYANGEGVKKDMKKAAKYYRMAASQGAGIMGNSWIYKKKYDEEN